MNDTNWLTWRSRLGCRRPVTGFGSKHRFQTCGRLRTAKFWNQEHPLNAKIWAKNITEIVRPNRFVLAQDAKRQTHHCSYGWMWMSLISWWVFEIGASCGAHEVGVSQFCYEEIDGCTRYTQGESQQAMLVNLQANKKYKTSECQILYNKNIPKNRATRLVHLYWNNKVLK